MILCYSTFSVSVSKFLDFSREIHMNIYEFVYFLNYFTVYSKHLTVEYLSMSVCVYTHIFTILKRAKITTTKKLTQVILTNESIHTNEGLVLLDTLQWSQQVRKTRFCQNKFHGKLATVQQLA